jgi:sn-glycerol 3-phosphate transport system ATP-binding protein
MSRPPGAVPPDSLAVGVRPEAVRLDTAGVPARIVAVEFLGADTLIEARVEGHPFIIRRPGRVVAQAGETLPIAWSPDDVHWFDLSSNRRIDVT